MASDGSGCILITLKLNTLYIFHILPKMNLRIFSLSTLADDNLILCWGETGTLLDNILWAKNHIPKKLVFSESNPYVSETLSDLLKTQWENRVHLSKNNSAYRTIVVFNKCFEGNMWTVDRILRILPMGNRSHGIMGIFVFSEVWMIAPLYRHAMDYIFISHVPSKVDRRRIYEQFSNVFPTLDVFCQLMDNYTTTGGCLVIHNGAMSSQFEDRVFYLAKERHT